ncbi:hypothetical protein NT6N_40050 [Oceaniferula spumae]|uniref:Uncharacterized protein n=1 Tax=Oceaniferula spumae TaxID=2979115 RepID=A0AAT9FSF6_9BACT
MKATITIDDARFDRNVAITGDTDTSILITKALETLITVDRKKRTLSLSGSTPDFTIPSRNGA